MFADKSKSVPNFEMLNTINVLAQWMCSLVSDAGPLSDQGLNICAHLSVDGSQGKEATT